jgi:hypothetical protein
VGGGGDEEQTTRTADSMSDDDGRSDDTSECNASDCSDVSSMGYHYNEDDEDFDNLLRKCKPAQELEVKPEWSHLFD